MNVWCTQYHEKIDIQKCGKCPNLDSEGQCDYSMSKEQFDQECPDLNNCDECLIQDMCAKKGCGDQKPNREYDSNIEGGTGSERTF